MKEKRTVDAARFFISYEKDASPAEGKYLVDEKNSNAYARREVMHLCIRSSAIMQI